MVRPSVYVTIELGIISKSERHSQRMFKMSAVCSDTSMEVLTPRLNCIVDDTLV